MFNSRILLAFCVILLNVNLNAFGQDFHSVQASFIPTSYSLTRQDLHDVQALLKYFEHHAATVAQSEKLSPRSKALFQLCHDIFTWQLDAIHFEHTLVERQQVMALAAYAALDIYVDIARPSNAAKYLPGDPFVLKEDFENPEKLAWADEDFYTFYTDALAFFDRRIGIEALDAASDPDQCDLALNGVTDLYNRLYFMQQAEHSFWSIEEFVSPE